MKNLGPEVRSSAQGSMSSKVRLDHSLEVKQSVFGKTIYAQLQHSSTKNLESGQYSAAASSKNSATNLYTIYSEKQEQEQPIFSTDEINKFRRTVFKPPSQIFKNKGRTIKPKYVTGNPVADLQLLANNIFASGNFKRSSRQQQDKSLMAGITNESRSLYDSRPNMNIDNETIRNTLMQQYSQTNKNLTGMHPYNFNEIDTRLNNTIQVNGRNLRPQSALTYVSQGTLSSIQKQKNMGRMNNLNTVSQTHNTYSTYTTSAKIMKQVKAITLQSNESLLPVKIKKSRPTSSLRPKTENQEFVILKPKLKNMSKKRLKRPFSAKPQFLGANKNQNQQKFQTPQFQDEDIQSANENIYDDIQMFHKVIDTPEDEITIQMPNTRPTSAYPKQVQFIDDKPKRLLIRKPSEKKIQKERKPYKVWTEKDEQRREKSLELLKELKSQKRIMVNEWKEIEPHQHKKQFQNLHKPHEYKFMGKNFFLLEPTLSLDHGPNNQEKVYNSLKLAYLKDEKTGLMREYAETKCMLTIPKLVKINKKKPKIELPPGTVTAETEPDKVTEKSVESCHSHFDDEATGDNTKKDKDQSEHQEWSLPLRLMIKQKDFVMGKEFKKMEKLDVYLSQNTVNPGPHSSKKDGVHHSVMKFNVKEKHNYDQEYGSNQVYQYIFGKEFFDLMYEAQRQERAELARDMLDDSDEEERKPKKKIETLDDALNVKYRNQIFITIRGYLDCDLEIAAQLTLQPKKIDPNDQALQMAKKQKKKVDYELIERLDKQLGQYYEENQPDDKVNYIKGNMIAAETQELKKSYSQVHQTKQLRSQNRKMMIDLQYREQAKKSLNRWDEYRMIRQQLIDKAVNLIKTKRRNQVIISLIQQYQVLRGLTLNYEAYKDYCRNRINAFFLAIKFKVRFRYRFCKKYGFDFDERQRKTVMKHITLLGPLFYETRVEKAKRVVTETLKRYNMIRTVKKNARSVMDRFHRIQSLWKRAIINSGWRRLFCAMMFSKEVDYLVWVYEKKLKHLKGPHGKTHKQIENIIDKLQKVKDPGYGKDYFHFPVPISRQGLEIIKLYQERMSAEYTLDYSIWEFVKMEYQRRKLESEYKGKNIYTEKEYLLLVQAISRCHSRLKDWRIKLNRLDQQIYVGTDIVDRDKLYKIDQEGFNREVLKIIPQNNDDLVETFSSPSPSKSPKKSSKKGKKSKKVHHHHDGHECTGHFHSVSFVKQEKQRIIVDLILSEELEPSDLARRDKLLLPYRDMGSFFPPYELSRPRENIQRLVVKAAKITI